MLRVKVFVAYLRRAQVCCWCLRALIMRSIYNATRDTRAGTQAQHRFIQLSVQHTAQQQAMQQVRPHRPRTREVLPQCSVQRVWRGLNCACSAQFECAVPAVRSSPLRNKMLAVASFHCVCGVCSHCKFVVCNQKLKPKTF